jgi:hypothetical protein
MSDVSPLTSAAIDVLRQLFLRGPVWDGNVVSKAGRTELIARGYAERNADGWQWLTASGVELAVLAGRERVKNDEWRRKAGCQ